MSIWFALALALFQPAHGQVTLPVTVELSHLGDTSHLEFKGRETWTYELRRDPESKEAIVVVTVPLLEAKSAMALKAWSSPLIEKIAVDNKGLNNQTRIFFTLKSREVQSFDYQTDQPSRLIVDFFQKAIGESKTVATSAPRPPATGKIVNVTSSKSKIIKIRRDGSEDARVPASQDFMLNPLNEEPGESEEAENGTESQQHGIFDGADPEFTRFRIKDYEIKESAVIASQQNIYLRFPMLHLEFPYLKAIQDHPPLYEIAPDTGKENEEVRLLQTLFERKRYAVFSKTLNYFEKKYPKSRYSEILRYMSADIKFEKWQESSKPADFDSAMGAYHGLLAEFPDSPLYERTALMVGYSYLQHGDFVTVLRDFQRFLSVRPNSAHRDQIKIAIAEAYANLDRHDEAIATLQDVQKTAAKKSDAIEASYRLGDISFHRRDYKVAIEAYKQAARNQADQAAHFPNAYFNTAESYFWLGQYRESLDAYREYLQRFPSQEYGGYAMTRVGELLEILGADQQRVMGAFLESYFRYSNTPGGKVARVRLLSQRLKNMKPKEMQKAMAESDQIVKESTLNEIPEFVTIVMADGLYRRGEYDSAIDRLSQFYQGHPSSKNLNFIQNRIVRAITAKIRTDVEKSDYMSALKTYSRYASTWLKPANRIDVRTYVGRSYELAGAFGEASRAYSEALNRIYAIAGTPAEKEVKVFESLPTPESLNLRLAAVNLYGGDISRATDYLQQIRDENKLSEVERVERVEILADITEKTGRPKEAARYLSRLVDTWGGMPVRVASPLLRLAKMSAQAGDMATAQSAIGKIIDLQTDTQLVPEDIHAAALELRGDLYVKAKKPDEALKAYQNLLDLYEKKRPLVAARYRMGDIEFKRGNSKEAEKIWAPLADNPNKTWFQMAHEQLRNDQFNSDYKKYINRIPAMANMKDGEK